MFLECVLCIINALLESGHGGDFTSWVPHPPLGTPPDHPFRRMTNSQALHEMKTFDTNFTNYHESRDERKRKLQEMFYRR